MMGATNTHLRKLLHHMLENFLVPGRMDDIHANGAKMIRNHSITIRTTNVSDMIKMPMAATLIMTAPATEAKVDCSIAVGENMSFIESSHV